MNDNAEHDSENEEQPRSARRPFGRPPSMKPPALAELPDRLLGLLRQSPVGEIEQNLKSLVTSTISKLDLVTREEFEIQQAMVEKLRDRIERIEKSLSDKDK